MLNLFALHNLLLQNNYIGGSTGSRGAPILPRENFQPGYITTSLLDYFAQVMHDQHFSDSPLQKTLDSALNFDHFCGDYSAFLSVKHTLIT